MQMSRPANDKAVFVNVLCEDENGSPYYYTSAAFCFELKPGCPPEVERLPQSLRDPMQVLERGRQIEESGGLRLVATPALRAYDEAMQAAGVPHEPLEVYTSNSWRRVGLAGGKYKQVMIPTVMRDGQPDIVGTDVLVALVAAFNAMLELRSEQQS